MARAVQVHGHWRKQNTKHGMGQRKSSKIETEKGQRLLMTINTQTVNKKSFLTYEKENKR